MVERNRRKIDPLFPSIVAVSMQLLATVYVFFAVPRPQSAIVCGSLTLVYAAIACVLNRKPRTQEEDRRIQ